MRANKVLKILGITRPTLTKYVKEGIIKAEMQDNNQYEYDDNSVYKLLNKGESRVNKCCSTGIHTELDAIKAYCIANGIEITDGYYRTSDVLKLVDDITSSKIEHLVVYRWGMFTEQQIEILKLLCNKFDVRLAVMSI